MLSGIQHILMVLGALLDVCYISDEWSWINSDVP